MHQRQAIAKHGNQGQNALGSGASEHHSEGIRAGGLAGPRFGTGDLVRSSSPFLLVGTPSSVAATFPYVAGGEA
jgi:hypothetical protein